MQSNESSVFADEPQLLADKPSVLADITKLQVNFDLHIFCLCIGTSRRMRLGHKRAHSEPYWNKQCVTAQSNESGIFANQPQLLSDKPSLFADITKL